MKGIKEIAEKLSLDISNRGLGDPFLSSSKCKVYPLELEKFHKIESPKVNRKMAFIDGGNQTILSTPEYSIQANRVYFNIFNGSKRILPESNIPRRIEFFSLTSLKFDGNEFYYETTLSPDKDEFKEYLPEEEDLKFKATDREIMVGTSADIARVASMARRFAEWSLSKHIIDLELDSNDILVRDGSLQTSLTNESKYTENAFNEAKKKEVIFTGLSKTCSLPTSTGLSLIGSIQRYAEECNIQLDKWCYGPIFRANSEIHKAIVVAVKLNKSADRIFRFEIFEDNISNENNELNSEILDIVSSITQNSKDIRFPGYPYGLIDADKWARVKNEELNVFKIQLKSEISKTGVWKKLNPHIKAINGHDKLDGVYR